MVEIKDRELNRALENFEEMFDALANYRDTLIARRERYEAEGRDPETYARVIAMNLRRIDTLEKHLNGETYDLLRDLLDGTGVLASVDEGSWI